MQRSDGSRKLKQFDDNSSDELKTINLLIWQWVKNNRAINPNPDMPRELRNRQADNWRPLIAIADALSSPYWSKAAREAAISLTCGYQEEDVGVILLSDIRSVFNTRGVDRMFRKALLNTLHELEDGIWSEWRGLKDNQSPHPLSQRELNELLGQFGIKAKTIWLTPRTLGNRGRSDKGYLRSWFEPAWQAYCSEPDTADTGYTHDKFKVLRSRDGKEGT
jgi:hypothetical protein